MPVKLPYIDQSLYLHKNESLYIKMVFLHGRLKRQPVSLVHAVLIDSHEGCLSAILIGIGPLQHLLMFSVSIFLLDLLYNIRLTFAHFLCRHCYLLEAFLGTSSVQRSTGPEQGLKKAAILTKKVCNCQSNIVQ